MTRWPAASTLALAAALLAAPATAERIPLPPHARASDLAPAIRINGLPTRIRSFEVEQPLHVVARHYRRWMGDARVDTRIGEWTVLARVRDDTLQTIRLRDAGDGFTTGTLAQSALTESTDAPGRNDFAPPAGQSVALEVDMQDDGRDARFLVWQSRRSLDASARQLRTVLGARGYHLEHALPVEEGGRRGLSLWFRGSEGEAIAILNSVADATEVSLSIVQVRPPTRP